jgi:hypothetical protein
VHIEICIIRKSKKMNTAEKIVVKRIEWLANESDMVLICENKMGNLSYNSRISLPSILMNKVISDMHKQQPEIDLNDCLRIEQWSETDVYYIYDFDGHSNTSFLYHPQVQEFNFRQIRA